jgi:transcriptional regulator with XRE-family HTH domain
METQKEEHWRQRLLELLAHLGLSQIRFAEDTGLDASYVSRLRYPPGKKGRKNLGLDTMATIRTRYKLAPGWFDLPLGADLPTALTYANANQPTAWRVAEPVPRWGAPGWPFENVQPDDWERLSPEERLHIENDILLRIRGREPPANQHQPAPSGAAA